MNKRVIFCILATVAWLVITWILFDPMSTIMFDIVKIPDQAYYDKVWKLNAEFYPLMLGPPLVLWILAFRHRG